MRRRPAGISSSLCAVLLVFAWARSAWALTAEVTTPEPSVVAASFTFQSVVRDAVGIVQYRWNFGDGVRTEWTPGAGEITHIYDQPGHYFVQLSVQDEGSSASVFVPHLVHHPVKAARPTASTSIAYDKIRNRIYTVNQDSDSITAIDADGLTKVAELPVYRRPEALAIAPDGKLWIVHRDDYAVAIVDLDTFSIVRGFRLPYASQPVGLAMSPAGKEAYVTLMAVGKLLKLDTATGQVLAEAQVGPWARGVSVTDDGKSILVTRFISSDDGGEVIQVDGASMKVVKRIPLAPDTAAEVMMDTDRAARGVPNYLFSVAITPDGRQAWVAAKKDNILRGPLRDGLDLSQDDTVRPLVGILDLIQGAEVRASRIDLDDRSLPAHVEFSPLGDFAFVTVAASNLIEVRSVYDTGTAWSIIAGAGITPRAAVLGPKNRLFVQGSLSRNVVVFDVSAILVLAQKTTSPKLAEISTVQKETLDPRVLQGKQLFHSSADVRMTSEGYLTCGTCHFEGIDDGRVFDFSSRGEGLRNTPALLGRRGTGHGRVDWSGNLDEVQDLEMQIRELFVGRGFIADDVLAMGTRKEPLGDAKAGLSPELDALAAYLVSLDHVNPSPFRNGNGSLTADGQAGKALFARLGCGFCHGGADFTDSARGVLHDVGTMTAKSGKRLGGALTGIDTPTLLGVWETAPYLHDGSAPTLRDVLTVKNPNDLHGFVSGLLPQQLDQLVAYLLQVDSELPVHRLPFDPPAGPSTDAGGTGAAGSGGGGGSGGADAGVGPRESPAGLAGGCACGVSGGLSGATFGLQIFLLLVAFVGGAGGWRTRGARRRVAATKVDGERRGGVVP